MRQIVLDTETTGLEWRTGDRVIEIGCVELFNRKPTGQTYHVYLNPERDIDAGAVAVHGLSVDFLADKPKFREVVEDFVQFIDGAELIIHNANFDVGFLNNELSLLGRSPLDTFTRSVLDTLKLAKEQNPGKKASLDALCERYEISNAHRTLHGALLDAQLLAEVYLAMTRGQETLIMDLEVTTITSSIQFGVRQGQLKVIFADEQELGMHENVLASIDKESKGKCLWQAKVEHA